MLGSLSQKVFVPLKLRVCIHVNVCMNMFGHINIFICIYVHKYLCMSCWIFILINLCIHVNVCMNNLHIQTSSYGYGAFLSRRRSCYMFRWLHLMIYEITIPKTDLLISLSLSLVWYSRAVYIALRPRVLFTCHSALEILFC